MKEKILTFTEDQCEVCGLKNKEKAYLNYKIHKKRIVNMNSKVKSYEVDSFLLAEEWIEKGSVGRISYVVRGGETEKIHNKKVEEIKATLLSENDNNYTSWVFTHKKYKNLQGYNPHVTVLQFRVRDAW